MPHDEIEQQQAGPLVELGASGLQRAGGIPVDEVLPQLRGDKWFDVVREMADNDSTVGTILHAIDQHIPADRPHRMPVD